MEYVVRGLVLVATLFVAAQLNIPGAAGKTNANFTGTYAARSRAPDAAHVYIHEPPEVAFNRISEAFLRQKEYVIFLHAHRQLDF